MTQSAHETREIAPARPIEEQYRRLQVLVGELLRENQELRFKLARMEHFEQTLKQAQFVRTEVSESDIGLEISLTK